MAKSGQDGADTRRLRRPNHPASVLPLSRRGFLRRKGEDENCATRLLEAIKQAAADQIDGDLVADPVADAIAFPFHAHAEFRVKSYSAPAPYYS